ncbi:hypothetical protein GCM10027048_05510 [Hymenobacter coalescens]
MSIPVLSCAGCLLGSGLLLSLPTLAQPTVSALSPTANLRNAMPTSAVRVTFSRAISAGSVAGLQVFSSMQRGLCTGHGAVNSVSGNQLISTPSFSWQPGETVQATVTTAVQDQAGRPMAQPYVFQFTAATGGTGRGSFGLPVSTPAGQPAGAARPLLGDMDNDGDLDLVTTTSGTATTSGLVSVRLNAGNGTFAGGGDYPIGQLDGIFTAVALGDVDNDGDLDLVSYASGAQVRDVAIGLNNGTGVISRSTAPAPTVGRFTTQMVLGDVDGDGDQDLLSGNSFPQELLVQLNNGSGTFTGNYILSGVGQNVVLGDVDNDGDLDVVGPNNSANQLAVRLNTGNGTFMGGSDYGVGTGPHEVRLGDLDADGDLDAVTTNFQNGTGQTVSVRLNSGTGVFGGGADINVDTGPAQLRLADLDADGDLDLLTYNQTANTTTALFNNGAAGFASNATAAASGAGPLLADLDGDQDLDLLTLAPGAGATILRLNQPASTLPVELVAFTAQRRGEAAHLRWTTAQEKNNRGFVVEVSADGHAFRRLGWVPGRGNATAATDYQFDDPALLRHAAPVVFYRLRQIDEDATEHHSPVQAVSLAAGQPTLRAVPNPFQHQLAVQVALPRAGAAQLVVYDALGRVRHTQACELPAGVTRLSLPTAREWPAGPYTLLLRQDGQRQVIKLLKE